MVYFFVGRWTGHRATVCQNGPFYRRARACPSPCTDRGETLSDARMASEGPRATVARTARCIVGRGPVPRHANLGPRATVGELRPFCRSRAPALGPVAIRRSQSTEGNTRVWPSPAIAGDRPPRYGSQNGPFYRRARACPSPCTDREGQALALRARKKKSAGDRPPRYGDREIAGDRPPRYGIQNGYFCRFTSPNVVSIRLDAETGPGNNRVTNVTRFPSNATSSIW